MSEMIEKHPDSEVASRWAAMARETISRYSGPPMPSQPVIDLNSVPGLTEAQASAVAMLTEKWLQDYFTDVRAQLMNVHADFLKLQKTVAELQVNDDASK
ncbi:MAG: hypothetical protein AB8B97_15230 [Granulosicoccus sp.]